MTYPIYWLQCYLKIFLQKAHIMSFSSQSPWISSLSKFNSWSIWSSKILFMCTYRPASFLTLCSNCVCFEYWCSLCLLCPFLLVWLGNACLGLSFSFMSMKKILDNSIAVPLSVPSMGWFQNLYLYIIFIQPWVRRSF